MIVGLLVVRSAGRTVVRLYDVLSVRFHGVTSFGLRHILDLLRLQLVRPLFLDLHLNRLLPVQYLDRLLGRLHPPLIVVLDFGGDLLGRNVQLLDVLIVLFVGQFGV